MTKRTLQLPLFPLHTVLCPGAALPLHIFEERYRLMVQHCLREGVAFGVVLILEGRESGPQDNRLAPVGTTAIIREAGRYPDGRLDIMTVGGERFRIESLDPSEAPFLMGTVSVLDEPLGDATAARQLATGVSHRFLRYLELLGPTVEDGDGPEIEIEIEVGEAPAVGAAGAEAGSGEPPPESLEMDADDEHRELLLSAAKRLTSPEDPTALSYVLSGLVELELPNRQQLLEASDTEARLRALDVLLRREIGFLELQLKPLVIDRRVEMLRRN